MIFHVGMIMWFRIDEHMSGCLSSFERVIALCRLDATKELSMGSRITYVRITLQICYSVFGSVRMVMHPHPASMLLPRWSVPAVDRNSAECRAGMRVGHELEMAGRFVVGVRVTVVRCNENEFILSSKLPRGRS
jgi:hypothetical protein